MSTLDNIAQGTWLGGISFIDIFVKCISYCMDVFDNTAQGTLLGDITCRNILVQVSHCCCLLYNYYHYH